MLGSAARTKGRWLATLVALVAGLVLLVMLTSPGSHPKPAQAQQMAKATKVVLSTADGSSTIAEFTKMVAVSSIDVTDSSIQARKIVLERPASAGGLEMSAWHEAAVMQQINTARKTVQLTFVNGNGQPTVRIILTNAWPSEYRLEQRGSELVEIVTLSAEHMERTLP